MAFALTRLRAWGNKIQTESPLRGEQFVELRLTGANTDVDCDIGDDAGVFWTDALADATYGDLAAAALTTLQAIVAQAAQLTAVESAELITRTKVLVADVDAASEYAITVVNDRPNILFITTDAPTAWKVQLRYTLDDGQFPIVASLGN